MGYRLLLIKAARTLVSVCLFVAAAMLWMICGGPMRILTGIALLVFLGCLAAYVFEGRRRAAVFAGIALVALAFSPIEVSMATRQGLPGIVPLRMGLPGPLLREKATRGEAVLGGCMTSGLEPWWVVIWYSNLSAVQQPLQTDSRPQTVARGLTARSFGRRSS
jgi:hypothetical protein